MDGPPKSRNFHEFGHFFPVFVFRQFFHAMNVKSLRFEKFLAFVTYFKLGKYFLWKVSFCKSFYPLSILTGFNKGYWATIIITPCLEPLLLKVVVNKQKKVYRDWWSKPVSVDAWISHLRHFLIRRKGIVLSQNKCFNNPKTTQLLSFLHHGLPTRALTWTCYEGEGCSQHPTTPSCIGTTSEWEKAFDLFHILHFNS